MGVGVGAGVLVSDVCKEVGIAVLKISEGIFVPATGVEVLSKTFNMTGPTIEVIIVATMVTIPAIAATLTCESSFFDSSLFDDGRLAIDFASSRQLIRTFQGSRPTAGIRRLAEARSEAEREGQVACMPLLGADSSWHAPISYQPKTWIRLPASGQEANGYPGQELLHGPSCIHITLPGPIPISSPNRAGN